MKQLIQAASAGCLTFALVACGGGGGSGSDNSGDKLVDVSPKDNYQGVTTPAVIAVDSMPDVLGLLFVDDELWEQDFVNRTTRSKQSRVSVNEREDCYVSGSGQVKANINDNTGTGYIDITFNQCDDGNGLIIDGRMRTELSNYDSSAGEPADVTLAFSAYTQRAYDGSFIRMEGTIVETNATSCNSKSVTNLSIATNNANNDIWLDNVVEEFQCSSDSGYLAVSSKGRYYLGGQGYFDINSDNFRFAEAMFDGGSYLRAVPAAGSVEISSPSSLLTVSVFDGVPDSDNEYDKVYVAELELHDLATDQVLFADKMPSWYLTTATLLDFSDEDQDGMWDGFERFYGLDPTIDDSFEDMSSNGFTNLEHFWARSDPFSWESTPEFYFHIMSGSELLLEGGLNAFLAEHWENLSLDISLDTQLEWTYEGDLCVLIDNQILRCSNLDYQHMLSYRKFPDYAEVERQSLGSLSFSAPSSDHYMVELSYQLTMAGEAARSYEGAFLVSSDNY